MKVALVVPNENLYSETFIEQHIKYLEGEILIYHGVYIPYALRGKGLIINKLILNRYVNKLLSVFLPSLRTCIRQKALEKSFVNEKVQAVFCEYGVSGAEIVEVCKRLKLPMIVHFHGVDISKRDLVNSYKEKYLKMFHYAFRIIAVSKAMKEMLTSLGASPEKVVINIYGPSADFYNNLPAYQNKQLISVGRFVNKKAPHLTIQAFYLVWKTHSDARLIICGDGPLMKLCKELVERLEMVNSVTFFGVASPKQIKSLFDESLMYVQHSVIADDGDMEGTPVALLEASAAGLPVVSTNHAGIPEVIINGETGILVDEHDVEGMARGMMKLLNTPDLAKKMGQRGRENIKENFSLEKHIATLNHIIKSSI